MKLNLTNKVKRTEPQKGDILVMKGRSSDRFVHYLIVENVPHGNFTLVNMNSLNLMVSTTGTTVSGLIEKAKETFRQFELVEVIKKEELELSRVSANSGGF